MPASRPFLVLALLLILWLLTPPVVHRLFRATVFEATGPAHRGISIGRDLREYWTTRSRSRDELIQAGRDVARYAAALEVSLPELELLRSEVERLERLLRMPARPGYRLEIARVERRDLSAWWQQLVIRKGANHGIETGAPVIFAGGVVGVVREVGAYSSVVDLISSPDVRIAALILGDPRPVEFLGGFPQPFRDARGIANFVPQDIRVQDPSPRPQLVTSGLGGRFPAGLKIGEIISLEPANDGLYQHGIVALDPRLAEVREVAVLLPAEDPTSR